MTAERLHWNQATGRYEGAGIWVDGDAYAEAVLDLFSALVAEGRPEQQARDRAETETADPVYWRNAADDPRDDSAGRI